MTCCAALIQARMSSTRFPGKVAADLSGSPMIEYMVRRVRRSRRLDRVMVVTSTDASDDALCDLLDKARIDVFRGDLHDVLTRYVDAARSCGADEIVRLTGDCPLIDPRLIDAVIDLRRARHVPYASNIDPPTFPDGMDVECCTHEALLSAHRHALPGPEREHVTLWMRSQAAGLARANLRAPVDLSALRLTVDYPDDLAAVRRLLSQLADPAGAFDLYDMLRAMAHDPDIGALNPHQRNEGLAQSLAAASLRPSTAPGAPT